MCMASLPFTLAALATSAVPDLTAVAVRAHNASGSDFASAILTTVDDEVIVSVPRNPQAETAQSASLLALTALSEGARETLSFAVPRVLGLTRAGETRAVVMTFIPGSRFDVSDLHDDSILIESLAESLAEIHSLPRSVAQQNGLPVRSARDQRLLVTRLVDRAAATRYLPETVHNRWNEVLETAELWDFETRIVHGSLSDETLLIDDDRVTGVLDWSKLAVGDPATDFAWLFAAGEGVYEEVFERYSERVGAGDARALRARAVLYHELEVANWLLHGVESHDQSIVDDAVAMLDRLVDRLSILASEPLQRERLGEAEAIELLDHTPEVQDRLSDTAAYEALDEDRMFGVDTDFIEPLPAEGGQGEPSDAEADERTAEDAASNTDTANDDEQLTQPIADEDLPGR